MKKNMSAVRTALIITLLAIVQMASAQVKYVTGNPNLKFNVVSCIAEENNVFVEMTVLNKTSNDIRAMLGVTNCEVCQVVDSNGNTYQASPRDGIVYVKVANQDFSSDRCEGSFLSGVPTKVTVKIENVPQRVASIARIQIPFWSDQLGLDCHHKVVIRNIDIERTTE